MDLRVSAVLLLMFITGGYSLKCYTCSSPTDSCQNVETCPLEYTKCASGTHGSRTAKMCVPAACKNEQYPEGSFKCCDTDLCNAADGLSKSSFLLLFVPLLFYYFMCQ